MNDPFDWEKLSYIATILPVFAGFFYWLFVERRKQREIEEEENRLELRKNYSDLQREFRKAQYWLADTLKNKLEQDTTRMDMNSIIHLLTPGQKMIFYSILISMLEESFILFYRPDDPEYRRLWNSWEDYINEMLKIKDFRDQLLSLLQGEDPKFVEYMKAKLTQDFLTPTLELA